MILQLRNTYNYEKNIKIEIDLHYSFTRSNRSNLRNLQNSSITLDWINHWFFNVFIKRRFICMSRNWRSKI